MRKFIQLGRLMVLCLLVAVAGCGGSGSTFINYDFNFGYLEKVAVIPLENLSGDQGSGARVTRYFTAALLASESFDVIEPGEVTYALSKTGTLRTAELTTAQIKSLGQEIGAQGLFLGTVSESATVRSGGNSVNVVTVVLRLVETDTGATVWSTTQTSDSSTFWSSLFGTGQKPLSAVTQSCIEQALNTLLD